MPPTCCSPDCVPTEHVNHLFKDDFKRTWNQKYAEASMRKQNQCPSRKCRAPIRPEDIRHHNNGRTSAVCRKCNTEICGICYKKRHESKKCPVDVNDEPGWKKCQKCHASVQLKDGCTHMTCPCGAEFCTVCGVKRKACKCPWFTYDEDSDESEDFDHVEVPAPVPMSMPPMGRGHPGGMDSLPRTLRPEPSFGFGGSRRPPRPDERAMRLPHPDDDYDDDEDEEDGYLQDFGDMGLGSPPPLFRPDDFRRSHSTLVPPAPTPPVPVPAPSVAPERANASANYVSGVNKARGVKGSSSMERLAGRFSDQRHGPQRSFGQPMSPPPMHPASAYGHPMPFQPPIAPISRRHTMDDDMYDMVFSPPFPGPFPRAAGPYDYMDDSALHAPSRRRRYRDPRPSELAGLTGPGSGMNRVAEWMDHVDENPFDAQTVT
ncbi:hypothetical protein GGS20DRAFT_580358 [Poronia punctata]|nr:hypothetical protein GGS20DRAFT_580358 [Poronia punctata]